MPGFPKVPLVIGDTDDDASIHLQSRVGPARPLPRAQKSYTPQDEEILKILSEADDELEAGYDFNKQFQLFQKSGSIPHEEDYDDDDDNDDSDAETQVESADELENEHNQKHGSNINSHVYSDSEPRTNSEEEEHRNGQKANKSLFEEFKRAQESTHPFVDNGNMNYRKYGLFAMLSFIITCIVLLIYQREVFFNPSNINKPIENYYEINSRFNKLESRVNNLDLFAEDITKKQDTASKRYETLSSSIDDKFNIISGRFNSVNSNLISLQQFESLLQEFNELKTKVSESETYSNPEPKLIEITEKLTKLSKVSDNIEAVKDSILHEFMDKLPERVPVYIKNNKIHYIPEFHKYIYNFIDSYQKEKNATNIMSWDRFLKENEASISNYFNSVLKKSSLQNISKEKLEMFLQKKINENNEQIWEKFNNLIDNLNIMNSNSTTISNKFQKVSSDIFFDNLLEIFAKGSTRVNYADYRLGSRILGFLTTSSSLTTSTVNLKSLPRRLFLGWFDYLNSGGIHKPKNWKYNANNVLIDGGNYWHCESNECTVGLRLSDPIILTDIILKNPPTDSVNSPTFVSIYIKPKNSAQVNELIEYLQSLKIDITKSKNHKYLKKFFKVKEISLDSRRPINHIKLPVSLINLKIPVKDIYIEIYSSKGVTGLYNLKAYGISEFSSYKYNQEFELLVDKLSNLHEDEASVTESIDIDEFIDENDSEILGSDEILF